MEKIINILIFSILIPFTSCSKGKDDPNPPDPDLPVQVITIDKSVKYQTIDGFGFFGGYDVWWGNATNMWNDAWGDKVISDLGISIWRNEYYPPSTPGVTQDADWAKQKPVVEGLKAKATKYGVSLKYVFSVWSPPADLKWECNFSWAGDVNATRNPGNVSTKNGGTLNPDKYTEYADWLKAGIKLYKDVGIDLYALSLQNELMFREPYNSCMYTITWYNDMVNAVVPKIKETYADVRIFGAENMLEMEGKEDNWKWFYHSGIKANPATAGNIDILAVHGYSDGVAATSGSELAKMWTNHTEQFAGPMNKPVWMSETSGYVDTWAGSGSKPGALSLAMDIYSALAYGNISAWIWWQGSQLDGMGEYNLMYGNSVGKRYYVSKHYYRYIRPGAVRVKSTSADADIFCTAYENLAKNTITMVVINSSSADKKIAIEGTDLPLTFSMYRTNSESDNCSMIKDVKPGTPNAFILPSKSIITLQAGGDAL